MKLPALFALIVLVFGIVFGVLAGYRKRLAALSVWPNGDRAVYEIAGRSLDTVQAVLYLHYDDGDDLCNECEQEWPCVTVRAVDGVLGETE